MVSGSSTFLKRAMPVDNQILETAISYAQKQKFGSSSTAPFTGRMPPRV